MVRVNYSSSRARHFAIGTPQQLANRSSFGQPTLTCIHERRLVGLTRFELVTPRLSSVCSNQLSYRPLVLLKPLLSLSKNGPRISSRSDSFKTR
jgi:hypothetical protein